MKQETKGLRTSLCLDRDWKFHAGEVENAAEAGFDDRDWDRVDVPHDYVNQSEYDPEPQPGVNEEWYFLHGCLRVGPAWYRKDLPDLAAWKDKALWIEFDGVFSRTRVWLNGRPLGAHHSGYTGFRFDLTGLVGLAGPNILAVRVDPEYDGWWYEGGGIYRHVRLVIADPVHVEPWGIRVTPHPGEPGEPGWIGNPADGYLTADSRVEVVTELSLPEGLQDRVEVLSEVLDEAGRVTASCVTATGGQGRNSQGERPAGKGVQVWQEMALPQAVLWSLEHPCLYRLRTTVLRAGVGVDRVCTDFGVRHVHFDANQGFFLNGKHLKLKGVNCHQDHAGLGVALPDEIIRWRLERLKETGCNAYRLSHNPVAPVTLDLCDRLGILVIAENRHLGDTWADQTPPATLAVEHRDLVSLVRRDRNHPCIILWSLCNEQWIQGTPEAAAMARAMKARIRELDPSRLVTAALNGGFDQPGGLISVLDVVGINYNPWVYDQMHRQFPDKPLLASEIASEIGTRGCYDLEAWDSYRGRREKGHVAAWSINAGPGGQVVEDAWPPVAERDFLAGGFVWSGFDYKGEPRPFRWPCIGSHYGMMDLCGFPKDNYHYYRAWWTDRDVIHLFPHWTWPDKEGQEIDVWVHSNAAEVELFLNGRSLGVQQVAPLRHLSWKVAWAPGELVARGRRDGRVFEARTRTAGEAFRLVLEVSPCGPGQEGDRAWVVNLAVTDRDGQVVPGADNLVTFRVDGAARILGSGNGDPSCHVPDASPCRPAFHGLAQVIIQADENRGAGEGTHRSGGTARTGVSREAAGGTIRVTATAPGLVPGILTLSIPGSGKERQDENE